MLIIGAGPSGLRAGAGLAGRGLDVRILEKKPAVGKNVICTGIVGKEAFREFGLHPDSVIGEISRVQLVSPFETLVTYEHPQPFACVVDREKFDQALAEEASSSGAALEMGTKVEDIRIEKSGVTVRATDRTGAPSSFSAQIAVIATGVDYTLQKKTGLGIPRDFLRGAQAEAAFSDEGITSIFVGKSVAPGAFAWMVPAGEGRSRIGLLTGKDARACLRDFLGKYRDRILADPESIPIRTKVVAQGLASQTVSDRILSVGEAAGQIKTTTGGGVSYGLLCADLAAEVISKCFGRTSFGVDSLSSYDTLWRKAIQKEIVIGYYTRKMCTRLSDMRVESLFRLAQTDGIIPIIRDKADFDWHSGLILALLKRLSFMKFFKIMREHIGPGNFS